MDHLAQQLWSLVSLEKNRSTRATPFFSVQPFAKIGEKLTFGIDEGPQVSELAAVHSQLLVALQMKNISDSPQLLLSLK